MNVPGATNVELPDWQKEMIDVRINAIRENPERLLLIDSLLSDLDEPEI